MTLDILCVCGARPNFMKIDAVVRAMRLVPGLCPTIVHTGQHYDERMFKVLFEDLGLPRPNVDLEVGSGSHAVQTARIIERFEPVLLERRPDLVLVVGDVNSTVACGLVAVKLGIPLGHVEAGLRSRDRTMPEEINRVVTDSISDLLFASEQSGMTNLRREGVPEDNLCFAGNVMIDTLLRHRERAEDSAVLGDLGVSPKRYAVLTLHRPANVDDPVVLREIVEIIEAIEERLPVVFPMHPRTGKRLAEAGLLARLAARRDFQVVEPLGYLDFLKLISHARVLLTDSGGIQEEATILRVPCLTLRDSTERPATIEAGFNRVVGANPATVLAAFEEMLAVPPAGGEPPERWDGRAGERIAARIAELGREGLARLRRVRAGG